MHRLNHIFDTCTISSVCLYYLLHSLCLLTFVSLELTVFLLRYLKASPVESVSARCLCSACFSDLLCFSWGGVGFLIANFILLSSSPHSSLYHPRKLSFSHPFDFFLLRPSNIKFLNMIPPLFLFLMRALLLFSISLWAYLRVIPFWNF